MAREGRSFVLSVSGLMRPDDLDEPRLRALPHGEVLRSAMEDMPWARGGSCVAGPDGGWVLAPVIDEAGVFVVEIDPADVRRARQTFDPAGHYARPDVFELKVDRRRQRLARFDDETPPPGRD
jgi:nitrilase